MMILGEDYSFRDDIKADTVPIQLDSGPYKGVVLRYDMIEVKENDDDSATVSFEFELFEMGEFTETKLRSDKEFATHVGQVLNSLIMESLNADTGC
jgi:hypothetical protein